MARPVELTGRGSRFIILASICLMVAALYFGREVLIPLALAVLLTFLLSPPVGWLERLRLPRVAATLIVIVIAVGAVVTIGYVVEMQFVSVVEDFPKYEHELRQKLAKLSSHLGIFRKAEQEFHNFGIGDAASTQPAQTNTGAAPGGKAGGTRLTPTTQPTTETPVPVRIVASESGIIQTVRDWAARVLDPLATAGLVLILMIFMLLNREDLRDRIIRLAGHGRLNVTTQALDDAGSRISRYLGALAIVNSAYGVCVAAGLWAAGRLFGHGTSFPNVMVWGMLVGLFRFVPYLGIWIGASVPLLLSFALFPGSAVFFAVLSLFIMMEIIVAQFVEPYWYGASTGMSALAVLVAAIFWTWLWGGIGLLLSTPMTVCLVVMGKYVPQLQFLDILLGDEPVLPPHIRLYQRLIAADEEEAAEVARDALKDKTLEEVFDEVIIPALAMAEHDSQRQRLDPERLAFVRQSIRDIVEELAEDAKARRIRSAAADTEQAAKEQPAEKDRPDPRPPLPKDCSVCVLSLPAKNESDEIVAIMLTQLLELRGYCAFSGSTELLASEMVEAVEKRKAQIICVSAMPPAAVAHARYLCKRLHARYPDINMVVGIWTLKTDPQRAKQRIACSDSVHIVTTLAQAQQQMDQLAQPFIATGPAPTPVPEPAASTRP